MIILSRRPWPALFLATVLVALSGTAEAKPVKASEVDAALSGLSDAELADVRTAEAAQKEAAVTLEREKVELEAARSSFEAAKLRLSSAESDAKAAAKDVEAATLLGDAAAIRTADSEVGRSERVVEWRKSLRDAAKAEVQYHTARVAHAGQVVKLREKELETARLTAWKDAGGPPDVDTALGQASTQVGRARKAVQREEAKVEKAEGERDEAARTATRKAP